MYRSILVFLFLFTAISSTYGQYKYDWIKNFFSTGVAPTGDIYSIEDFGSIYEFEFDPQRFVNVYPASVISRDMFAAKYDSAGNFLWLKNIPFIGDQWIEYSKIGENNRIYLYGTFTDSMNCSFDITNPYILHRAGASCFIAVYDSSMQLQSATSFADITNDFLIKAILPADSTAGSDYYLAGDLWNAVDFDWSGVTNTLTPDNDDIVVAKYTSIGGLIWANQYGTNANESLKDIKQDWNGNLILAGNLATGSFVGLDTFQLGINTYYLPQNIPHSMALRLQNDGSMIDSWVAKGRAASTGIVSKETDIFMTGFYITSVDFDFDGMDELTTFSGDQNNFVVKLDSNFNYINAVDFLDQNVGQILVNPIDGSLTTCGGALTSMDLIWLDTALTVIQQKSYNAGSYGVQRLTYAQNGDLFYYGGSAATTTYEPGTIPLVGTSGTFKLTANCFPVSYLGNIEDTLEFCATITYPGGFVAGVNANGTGLRYQWYEDGAPMLDVNNPPLSIVGSSEEQMASGYTTGGNGVHYYHCVMEDGCGNIIVGDSVVVLFYNQPDDGVFILETIDTISGINITLNAPTPVHPSYMWKKGNFVLFDNAKFSGTTTSNLTINNLNANDQGTYSCYIANTSCSAYYPLYKSFVLTLEDIGLEDLYFADVILFPNPAIDEVYIQANQEGLIESSFITDAVGKIYLNQIHEVNISQYRWNIEALAPGIYFLTLLSENHKRTIQFIKL